ncbi:hypothetical protein FB567DRAFT_589620 [Paraphoma chrysanthemicola]|uniref:Uncharacterized protein n=1 Tax=Paraphoma chrysanthemicola TaxID=798071 RepID=A0A8K0W1N4_9PLEO|nr:hypothetical protein FB567DRAFT_589620 [Paraphoma chrysanthemicola]
MDIADSSSHTTAVQTDDRLQNTGFEDFVPLDQMSTMDREDAKEKAMAEQKRTKTKVKAAVKKSLSEANALIECEMQEQQQAAARAADYFTAQHFDCVPQYAPQRRPRPIRRGPLSTPAQTSEHSGSSQSTTSSNFSTASTAVAGMVQPARPTLSRPTSERRVSDFLAPERVATFDDVKHKRSRNLHSFQILATKGFKIAKEGVTKVAGKLELSVQEHRRARK